MDALIQWTQIAAQDLLRFVLVVGFVYLVVNVGFAACLKNRKIQRGKITAGQVRREISYTLITILIFSGMGWLVHLGPLRPFMRVYTDLCEYSFGIAGFDWIYVFLSLAVTIVGHDAYFYWLHRLMHHPVVYRRVHHLHHRSTIPSPTTAYAFAPGEALGQALFLPLILSIVPLHPLTVGLFMLVMISRNALAHAGLEVFPAGFASGPLRWSTTVTHHDLHHQFGAGNYGFYFTWWDRFMGTERMDYHKRYRGITENA